MEEIQQIIESYSNESIAVLDKEIPIQSYTSIDLSVGNQELNGIDIGNHRACQRYIDRILKNRRARIAYGGYLEKRTLYQNKAEFTDGEVTRNIHLGMDFWTKAGTKVLVPIAGKVHSFKNNNTFGDYGPTIILQHRIGHITFFTLYGHLSLKSLDTLYVGKVFNQGGILATLGTPDINVGYAPHLHFQIIGQLGSHSGNYPGVCAEKDLKFYASNCPNPGLLLKMGL